MSNFVLYVNDLNMRLRCDHHRARENLTSRDYNYLIIAT